MSSDAVTCPMTIYRRGVFRRQQPLFAGRGIPLPGLLVTAAVSVIALGLGVGAAWATVSITDAIAAADEPSESATPVPSMDIDVTLEPLAPITRALTADDERAGVTSTDFKMTGDGVLTVVPGSGKEVEGAGDVRWVSISVEGGVNVDAEAFADYVMEVLKDNRGWGSGGTFQFVRTDGAADYRVVLASPTTAAALCPDPHVVANAGPVAEVTLSPGASATATPSQASNTASATAEGVEVLCDDSGGVVLSTYDWIKGIDNYADDVNSSRIFMIQHRLGHLLGKADASCSSERADIMVNQDQELPEGCAVNPWPFPDASPVLDLPDSSTTAAPSAGA